MQNTDITKIRNSEHNFELIDQAKSVKWAIASRIKIYTDSLDTKIICLVYMSIKAASLNSNNPLHLDEALNAIKDRDIQCFISENISRDIWDAVKDVCFGTPTEILEVIPFLPEEYSGRFGEYSTPKTIGTLAKHLLEINEGERVADFCCGKGNFLLDTYIDNPNNKYYGEELNTNAIYISKIKFDLLEGNTSKKVLLKHGNVFDGYDSDNTKYDKIFSNYPFAMRIKEHPSMIRFVQEHPEFKLTTSASADWAFNALIKSKLSKDGKAVVIMPNGPLFKFGPDMEVRKLFIENGYIETIIALPKNVFDYTSIPSTMLVFGKNSKNKIRFVDASECYAKTRRVNVLSNENINTILEATKKNTDISRFVDIKELEKNDYNLTPQKYLTKAVELKNAKEFGSIIKNITRGAGITAVELDKISSADETDYQYVMLANIKGGIIDSKLPYITQIPEKYERYCIKNNNLLLSKNGAPYKVAVATVEDNKKILANGNLFVIEIDEDKADPHYLKAFFNSQEGNKLLSSLSTNGTMPSISVNDLKKAQIPLPSLKKQKEIANKFLIVEDEIKVLEIKINKCREKLIDIFNTEEDA